MSERILIAGIGNIFLGDDAFGVEVVRRLSGQSLPRSVRVVDFGIRGFDLAYALMDGYDAAILVDATPRGGMPGTVYTLEPDLHATNSLPAQQAAVIDAHSLDPVSVLRLVKTLGGECNRVLVVGCEPESFGTDDEAQGRMGLSEPVEHAVDEALRVIVSLTTKLLGGSERGQPGHSESPRTKKNGFAEIIQERTDRETVKAGEHNEADDEGIGHRTCDRGNR